MQNICETTNFFTDYFLSRTEVINELICLANMENINALLIDEGVSQGERLLRLNQIAINQMRVLENDDNRDLLK